MARQEHKYTRTVHVKQVLAITKDYNILQKKIYSGIAAYDTERAVAPDIV